MTESQITWRRTQVHDEVLRYDFTAEVDGTPIGRIRLIPFGPNAGHWRWSFTLSVAHVNYPALPPLNGYVVTKAEAVEMIAWAFDLVCAERRKSDLKQGRTPEDIFGNVCAHPGCGIWVNHRGGLCYLHDPEINRSALAR